MRRRTSIRVPSRESSKWNLYDAVSYGNPTVSASGAWEYDALYQGVKGERREHPFGQPTGADHELLPTSAWNPAVRSVFWPPLDAMVAAAQRNPR